MKVESTTPGLSPEQQVILGTIRIDQRLDRRVRKLLKQGLNWTTLRKTALHHRVLPLLYTELKTIGEDLVPEEEMAKMKTLFIANSRRNLRLAQRLITILDLLKNHGIKAIPIKGPVLAMQAYGDLALRHFTDIDILIHRQDFRPAYELLTAAGYDPVFPVTKMREKRLFKSDHHLFFRNQVNHLEVHWAITPRSHGYRIKPKHLWQQLHPIQLNRRKIRVLSTENTLLTLCIHWIRHQCWYWQLNWIVDIAHLIRACPDIDWLSLFSQAKRIGARRILSLGLQMAEEFCGINLPPFVHARFQSDRTAKKIAVQMKAQFLTDSPLLPKPTMFAFSRFFLQTRERLGDRLFHFVDYYVVPTFKPMEADRKVVPLPGFFHPLYYLIRPFRLIIKYCLRFFRFLFKR
jgi:hypothetical protein